MPIYILILTWKINPSPDVSGIGENFSINCEGKAVTFSRVFLLPIAALACLLLGLFNLFFLSIHNFPYPE